ncbi:MAG: hypothetical protein PHF00_01075, partial [Elusimicrobia bacterium]|nr:hypothetical protein [Elusimicrobiota bacterium]
MQVNVSSAGFTYDIGVATAALTTPAAAYLNDETPELVGTSTDSTSGVGTVELAISSAAGAGGWLTGLGGTFTGGAETWISTSGYTLGSANDTWRRTTGSIAFENGKNYRVRLRANDKAIPPNAGGDEGAARDYDALYDNARPTASISDPVNGVYKKANFTISGGSSDPDPDGVGPLLASNVSTVAIRIQLLGTGGSCYKPGTGFGEPCPYYFPAFGTPAAWTFTANPNPFSNGNHYLVLARATDNAGKVQNVYAAGTSSNVFIYADQRPESRVTAPDGSAALSALSDISGTAGSFGMLSPIESVGLSIGEKVGAVIRYHDGAGFTSLSEQFLPAAFVGYASGTWTHGVPGLTSGLHYFLRSKTTDFAGNVEDYAAVPQVEVIFDHSKPTGTISNLNGTAPAAYHRSVSPVTGAAFDNPAVSSAGLAALASDGVQLRILEVESSKWWNDVQGAFNQPNDGLAWFQANSGSPAAWSYSHAELDNELVTGNHYLAQFRGKDMAAPANQGPSSNGTDEAFTLDRDSVTFIADKVPAQSTVTSPVPGAVVPDLAAILGTAWDGVSGVSNAGQIEVSLQEISPNQSYWSLGTGSFTKTTEEFNPVSAMPGGNFAGGVWSFNKPAAGWTDQFKYRVRVRARDAAEPGGNLQTEVSSVTFTIDANAPGAGITYPIGLGDPRGNFKNLFIVRGTAADAFGIRAASVSFQEADTQMYYDLQTTTCSSAGVPKWVGATLSGSAPDYTWTLNLADLPVLGGGSFLQDNKSYNLVAISVDVSGNPSAPSTQVSVRFDQTPPRARVTIPVGGSFLKALPSVTGTADDPNSNPSPLGGSQMRIQRDDDSYWSGTGWVPGEIWLGAASGSPWTKSTQLPPPIDDDAGGLKDGRFYTLSARAYDVAGNTQPAGALFPGASFYFDISSPTLSIQTPANGSRQHALSAIVGTAQDNVPGDFNVKFPQVRVYDIAYNRYWYAGDWRNSAYPGFPDLWLVADSSSSAPSGGVPFSWSYASAVNWLERDNELRVEARVEDQAGNWTLASSTFSYDPTRPVSLTTYPWTNGTTFSSMTVIAGRSRDDTSPIKEVGVRIWYLSAGTSYYWSPGQSPRWQPAEPPPDFISLAGSGGPKATYNPWTYANADFTDPNSLTFAWNQAAHDGDVAPQYGNGKTFYIVSQAQDEAGNVESAVTTRTFVFDNVPPQSGPALPGPDRAYRSLPDLAGTSVDLVSPVASAALTIFGEVGAGCPSNKYFDGNDFTSDAPIWLSILPTKLYQSSWTYSNINLPTKWVNGCHYVVKSSATDAIGNVQAGAGTARFLYDTSEPTAGITNLANGVTYPNYQSVGGGASDPGCVLGVCTTGSGVYPSDLSWMQGKPQVMIFRDTEPYMTAAGPIPLGGVDSSGFYWDGTGWGTVSTWVDAAFTDSLGGWQYDGLKCPAAACWVNGDQYVAWSRVVDNAGSTQTAVTAGPKFSIAADAKSFKVTVSADPMAAGTAYNVTVEAKDDVNGTGATARGYDKTVVFYIDRPADGPEVMDPFDDIADVDYGLPREQSFTVGPGKENGVKTVSVLPRSAKDGQQRTFHVEQKDKSSIYGEVSFNVNPAAAEKMQVIADWDPLGQLPAPGKMGPAGSEGRTG